MFAGYLGCYNNTGMMKMTVFNGYRMDVVRWFSPPFAMTTDRCAQFCEMKGFSHAALQASYLCFCLYAEQVTTNLTKVNEFDCQAGCTGNENQICGDVSMLSVYETQQGMVGQGPSLNM